MTFDFDNNNFATAGADEGIDTGTSNMPVKISSVTAGTDKAAEKAAKQAAKEQERAEAKKIKAEQKAAEKAEKVAAKAAEKAAELAKQVAIEQAVKGALVKGAELAKKYEATETSIVAFKDNSRQATFGLLVDVLAYVEELNKRTDLSEVLATMRVQLWKYWKIKTQENTSDLGVIVKYITRTKRKNAHMYTRVLEEAIKHKANSGNLLIYIEQRGGINKIVASSKAKGISNKQRLHNAYKRYAQFDLSQKCKDSSMGKIALTDKQMNRHFDTRDNARFVYTFGQIIGKELVVIDFVPWINEERENEFLLFDTLSKVKVPGNSTKICEQRSDVLHDKMAVVFDKFNAGRVKRNLPQLNKLGEAASGPQPEHFSVFDWKQFDDEYAEYLAAKAQQAE